MLTSYKFVRPANVMSLLATPFKVVRYMMGLKRLLIFQLAHFSKDTKHVIRNEVVSESKSRPSPLSS
jgi:hypothetical protein